MTSRSFAAALFDQESGTAPLRFIRFFADIGIDDVPLVGGKNASIGEMYRELTPKGILVPNGFAITAEAYRYTLEQAGAWRLLQETLAGLKIDDVADLARRAAMAREIVYCAPLPQDVLDDIRAAWERLSLSIDPNSVSPCVPRPPRRTCRM